MNFDDIIPGLEEAVRTVRPIDETPEAPPSSPDVLNKRNRKPKSTSAAAAPDLGAELKALDGLTSADAKLKHCEAVFTDCGAEMSGGTSKVLRAALHLAYVGRHDLWTLPQDADEKPLHQSLTAYCATFLKKIGCGTSTTRVSRLLQEGHLGLDLHAAGLVLPTTAEPLRTVIDAKLEDAIGACRQLIAAHQGTFPGSGETETFLATLPKKKASKKKSTKTGWRERVTDWSEEGKALAQAHAPYDEIEAVFEKIAVYAATHGKSGTAKKTKADKAA